MASTYVDKSALNTIVACNLSSSARAIAESVTHNNRMVNLVRRDISSEVNRIAKECEKNMLYGDAGIIYEKTGDADNAIRAYDTGRLYFQAGNVSINSGKKEMAEGFAKKLELEKPDDALILYKKLGNVDGIGRCAKALETKQPFTSALGYISIGDKADANRCADILEAAAKQDPANEKKIMIDVAYIRMHSGDHEGAAAAYDQSESPQMADFLRGGRKTECFFGVKIRSDNSY